MKTLNNTQINAITEFLANLNTEIDVLNCLQVEEIDVKNAYEYITEQIQENNGFDIEIIYYSNAIEYLKKNDASLNESLAIASELGYTIENLNSEILASLLASQNARDEFYELQSEIDGFFESLCEELEE